MSYAYKNLNTPSNIPSGLSERVLLAPKSWITALAVPTAPFNNQGDEITITTAHTFAASKGFKEYQLAPQKNKLDSKSRGELGLNGQMSELDIFLPGSYVEVHEQARKLQNTPHIALIKDVNGEANLWYQIGTDTVSAYITVDFSTGTTKDGVKGFNAKVTCDAGLLFYNTGAEPVVVAD